MKINLLTTPFKNIRTILDKGKRSFRKSGFLISIGLLLLLSGKARTQNVINVRDLGAKGDGITMDTKAIQRAIDQASFAGGGIISFPAGQYLTGTLFLKDNITLDLSAGCTILGSTNIGDYPLLTPPIQYYNKENIHFSLIYSEGHKNISIQGNGMIDGRGSAFTDHASQYPVNYTCRPFLLWFVEDSNILIRDIRLQNSGYWMQHYLACDNILIEGITVFNHSNKNNDMMDIDGCRNVRILHCIGDSDDDGITLKSMNERPDENILISDCIVSSHCNAIKCGTESSGGFKNIVITNCIIKPSVVSDHTIYGNAGGNSGITLAAVDGGDLDGIQISNIRISGPLVPLFFRLGNRARPYSPHQSKIPVGHFRNVMVSHILADGASKWGCLLAGIPGHEIENIQFSDITLHFSGGGTRNSSTPLLPEYENKYPDAEQFGPLDAYGFQIRHARHVTMDHLVMDYQEKEERPAIVLEDVIESQFRDIQAKLTETNESFFKTTACGQLLISDCFPHLAGAPAFFMENLSQKPADIVLLGNDFRGFQQAVKGDSTHLLLTGNIGKK